LKTGGALLSRVAGNGFPQVIGSIPVLEDMSVLDGFESSYEYNVHASLGWTVAGPPHRYRPPRPPVRHRYHINSNDTTLWKSSVAALMFHEILKVDG